jgi:membrane-bound lytic murein transglycosylase D
MISRILAEEGVPQELIHLAQAESGFVPRAVSRKACVGMWQFYRPTGAQYGLNANSIYDDRLDPEKATRAAARHLRDLYNQTGDWYLAMAAYNCGPMCVERAVQRTGYADFWELHRRNALPKETRNYVPAILAMTIVSKNLAAYGIPPVQPEPPLEYDDVELTAPANLGLIADAADVPVADIRDLNPHLLRNVAPAGTTVRVPKHRSAVVLAGLASVPVEKRSSWRLHRIGDGETLASIARRYSTLPKSIVAANSKLDESFFDDPAEGEMLIIPAAAEKERRVASKPRSRSVSSRTRSYPARSKSGARVTTVSNRTPAKRAATRR